MNAAEEMENFYSRCLLCTCTPDVTPHLNIFSEAGSQLQLSEKINKYLNIQIVAELPQNVCHSCMEKLEVTHELVTSSQQASITLLQIKQQWEVIKQEISDCLTKDLDFDQPAIEDENYMDTTTNEMPIDSTQSASEDFVRSGNDVGFSIEESTRITDYETTNKPDILKMMELKQCHFCQSEMYSQVLELHLLLCHEIYQEPTESDLNRTLQCLVCQCQLPSELMQDHILHQHPPKPNPKLKNHIQCHYCHMQFSYCDMAQHLESHHGPNEWTECLHCKKMVRNTQIDLEIHLFHEHSGGQFLACVECDLMFALTWEEQAHMQTHLNYKFKCPLQSCSQIFDTFTSFRHHVLILHPGFEQHMQDELQKQTYDILHPIATSETHPQIESDIQKLDYGGPVECNICSERLRHKYSLIEHKNKDHNMNLTFDCDECELSYSTYQKFADHIRGKHDELLEYNNSEHLNVVANPQPFTGHNDHVPKLNSNKLMITQQCLKMHKTHRRFGSKRQNLSYVPLSPVSCDICNYKARNKLFLLKHINLKHLDVVVEPLLYCCDLCEKEFTTCRHLMSHRRMMHLPKIKCKHCGKMIVQYFMQNHLFKSHGECREKRLQSEKSLSPVQCNICNYKAASKFILVKHMNSKHLEVVGQLLPFCCDLCDREYDSYYLVMKHRRNVHLSKLQCNECGKVVNKYKMDVHMRQECRESATKSRYLSDVTLSLVPCSLCDHYATDKFTLLEHMNSEHPNNTDQRFRCEVCRRQFIQFHSLMNHRRNVHVPKQQCGKIISKSKMSTHPKSHDKQEEYGVKHCSTYQKLTDHIRGKHDELLDNHNSEHLNVVANPLPFTGHNDHVPKLNSDKPMITHLSKRLKMHKTHRRFGSKRRNLSYVPLSPVSCDICTYKARNKLLLLMHINSKHLDVVMEPLPYCCDLCDKEFTTCRRLMGHRRMVHLPKIECKHCSKLIGQYRMQRHLIQSHGECRDNRFRSDKSLSPVQCNICNYKASSKFILVKHMNSMHLEVMGQLLPFCCDLCDREYDSYDLVMKHRRNVHLSKLQCNECGKVVNKYKMDVHMGQECGESATKGRYLSDVTLSLAPCSLCDHYATDKFTLLEHMNSEHPDNMDQHFRCEVCRRPFIQFHSLMNHRRNVHVPKQQCDKIISKCKMSTHPKSHDKQEEFGVKHHYLSRVPLLPVICGLCNFKARSKFSLVKHWNNEHLDVLGEPLPFCCDLCDKTIIQHSQMMQHRRRFHSPKKKCKLCGKLIKQFYMSIHVKRFHGKERQKIFYVQCSMCNYQTKNKLFLVKHFNLNHLDVVGERQPLCCKVCNKEYVNRKYLNNHRIRIHVPRVKCKKCGKMIIHNKMSRHLELHCTGRVREAYCCKVCNKEFVTHQSMMEHRKRTHIPKLWCEHCSKMISDDRMEKHLVHLHTKRRFLSEISLHPVFCSICSHLSVNKYALVTHFNVKHLDVFGKTLPYLCELCGNKFSNYHYLMLHLKRVHEPKKKCNQCDKIITRNNMNRHLNTHKRDRETSSIGLEGNNTTMMSGFEEKFNPEIEIVEHPIKPEVEEQQMDFLPEPQSADVNPAPLEYKLPECQVLLSKILMCEACSYYTENTTEFAMHLMQAHQHKSCPAK